MLRGASVEIISGLIPNGIKVPLVIRLRQLLITIAFTVTIKSSRNKHLNTLDVFLKGLCFIS
jgi:hypothetical protein